MDNITKKTVELNNSYSSDSKSSGVSAGVNIGYGRKVLTDHASVSVSTSKSNMNSNGTSYQNGLFVNVDEEHNNTKNMTLIPGFWDFAILILFKVPSIVFIAFSFQNGILVFASIKLASIQFGESCLVVLSPNLVALLFNFLFKLEK